MHNHAYSVCAQLHLALAAARRAGLLASGLQRDRKLPRLYRDGERATVTK